MTSPAAEPAARAGRLVLRLDGFEGPLDLLLELARGQRVDLARISILALVEQYLDIVEGARAVRLELAADWLVMAAWLAWLKSRLLLPEDGEAAEEGEQAAEVLAARLVELAAMRTAAAWLGDLPQLGRDVHPRGAPETFFETDRSGFAVDLPGLMRGYLTAFRRAASAASYRPRAVTLWTVKDALQRLEAMLGSLPDRSSLERFLPPFAELPQLRAALATTLLAGLELARSGTLRLTQEEPFGPILVGRGETR